MSAKKADYAVATTQGPMANAAEMVSTGALIISGIKGSPAFTPRGWR